jgi:hypothetical protein
VSTKVQPIATFEYKALGVLAVMFPSIYLGGHELVLCADDNEKIIVQHKCIICDLDGHKNCAYVQTSLYLYMVYKKQRFEQYRIINKKVVLREEWDQIPIPHHNNEIKNN